jgi:DNA-binding PadR family transcriptional regulator
MYRLRMETIVTPAENPQALLPLTPAVFYVLLALADEDRHGYGIAKDVASRTNGAVRLGPGTLYGTLTRMTESGLVAERGTRPSDERRKYYRLTPFGRRVAEAEACRLADMVSLARAKSLLTHRPERSR